MNEIFITIIIFVTIGFFGVLNLNTLNDKFTLEKEATSIFNELNNINLKYDLETCLKKTDNYFEIFEKDSLKTLKNFKINNKILTSMSTQQICCYEAISCTPSTLTLTLNNFTCKITISLRGQIKKLCNKE